MFESGVASYVRGRAVITVYFPVDAKGNADTSCVRCFYYSESSKRCLQNNEKPAYPSRYVGDACPLMPDEEFVKYIEREIKEDETNQQL